MFSIFLYFFAILFHALQESESLDIAIIVERDIFNVSILEKSVNLAGDEFSLQVTPSVLSVNRNDTKMASDKICGSTPFQGVLIIGHGDMMTSLDIVTSSIAIPTINIPLPSYSMNGGYPDILTIRNHWIDLTNAAISSVLSNTVERVVIFYDETADQRILYRAANILNNKTFVKMIYVENYKTDALLLENMKVYLKGQYKNYLAICSKNTLINLLIVAKEASILNQNYFWSVIVPEITPSALVSYLPPFSNVALIQGKTVPLDNLCAISYFSKTLTDCNPANFNSFHFRVYMGIFMLVRGLSSTMKTNITLPISYSCHPLQPFAHGDFIKEVISQRSFYIYDSLYTKASEEAEVIASFTHARTPIDQMQNNIRFQTASQLESDQFFQTTMVRSAIWNPNNSSEGGSWNLFADYHRQLLLFPNTFTGAASEFKVIKDKPYYLALNGTWRGWSTDRIGEFNNLINLKLRGTGKMEEYEILDDLGTGFYGTVSLYRHKPSGEIRAIKFVEDSKDDTASREIAVLQRLNHDHIIKYHESFIEGKYACIVLEFADAGNLKSIVREGYSTEEREVVRLIQEISSSLHYLHTLAPRRLLHADVKPDNILGFHSDIGIVWKLADFGIADFVRRKENGHYYANYDGRPPYAYQAPEILRNEEFSFSADIWGLGGVISFYCNGGSHLFSSEEEVLNWEKRSPLPDYYSKKLHALVVSMLDPVNKKRPSAQEVFEKSMLLSEEFSGS